MESPSWEIPRAALRSVGPTRRPPDDSEAASRCEPPAAARAPAGKSGGLPRRASGRPAARQRRCGLRAPGKADRARRSPGTSRLIVKGGVSWNSCSTIGGSTRTGQDYASEGLDRTATVSPGDLRRLRGGTDRQALFYWACTLQ